MLLASIKLTWISLIRPDMIFLSLLTMIFVIILYGTLNRLIGRKSLIDVGLTTLGISVIKVLLRPISSSLPQKILIAIAHTESPTTSQWCWKKAGCKSSGPSTLKGFMSNNVIWISSLVTRLLNALIESILRIGNLPWIVKMWPLDAFLHYSAIKDSVTMCLSWLSSEI